MKKIILLCTFIVTLFPIHFAYSEQQITEHKSYPWFKQSFLDLSEDLSDAKENEKGIILYFHQEGCPYCKKLLNDNFSHSDLVAKLRKQYDFIAINMWGDSDVTDFTGEALTEKTLAIKLKVMFTPTLIFFNNTDDVEFRLNGYYSPEKFHLLLDFLEQKKLPDTKYLSFINFYRDKMKQVRQGDIDVNKPQLIGKNYANLVKKSSLPVMVLFDEANCTQCNELQQMFRGNKKINNLLQKFTLSRVSIHSKQLITDIHGKKKTITQWSEDLKIQHTPSLVFFVKDSETGKNKEIFRVDSYLRAFHLESVLLYIADKHYIQFPEFQRYIHERVDRLQEKGIKIELWD